MTSDFGKRLKALRIKAGLSQEKLARLTGVVLITVFRWENGERIPRADDLNRLAAVFGVSTDELINGSPKQELKINFIWEVEQMENLAVAPNTFNMGIRGNEFLFWGALPQSMSTDEIIDRIRLELEAANAAAKARNKVLSKKEV